MKIRSLVVLALLVLLVPSLAVAAKVRTGFDEKYDFSQVKTWRFQVDEGPGGPNVDGRIRAELRTQLAAKGLREVTAKDQPVDVLVLYNVGAADGLVSGFVAEVGWYGDILGVPGGARWSPARCWSSWTTRRPKSRSGRAPTSGGNTAQALMVMVDRVEKAVRRRQEVPAEVRRPAVGPRRLPGPRPSRVGPGYFFDRLGHHVDELHRHAVEVLDLEVPLLVELGRRGGDQDPLALLAVDELDLDDAERVVRAAQVVARLEELQRPVGEGADDAAALDGDRAREDDRGSRGGRRRG